ncbi:MAG: hydrolase 1, exosortase A system-associated [Burkholderiales bacterium]
MPFTELPLVFACAGESLVGMAAVPERPHARGVVIVVGGPQYRAGSHRQFVQLARALAGAGFAVLRFDYRGMGDSDGDARTFEAIDADIDAAIGALCTTCPQVREVVLLGLCDAASAALLYVVRADPRVGGLVLLNPEVRDDQAAARVVVQHYYGRRIASADFWRKILRGQVDVVRAAREAATAAVRALARRDAAADLPYQVRMARSLRAFGGRVLVVLSGDDFTARIFTQHARDADEWKGLLAGAAVCTRDVAGADHTFSQRAPREALQRLIVDWLGVPRGVTGA